jgi:hypothetical protein
VIAPGLVLQIKQLPVASEEFTAECSTRLMGIKAAAGIIRSLDRVIRVLATIDIGAAQDESATRGN